MNSFLKESHDEALEKIVIDLSHHKDFFVVNEKEIFYMGFLYDVKYKVSNENQVIFYCKKDEKEVELLNHFIKLNDESKQSNRKNPLNNIIQKTTQILYSQKLVFSNFQLPSFEFCCSAFIIKYNPPDLNLLTPPPQIPAS